MSILKIKRLHPQAQLPARATDGSAGHDLYACIEQPTEILPGQTVKVPTGLAIQLESRKYVALIFARSSMGTKYGVIPANAVGVIDSDYRGRGLCLSAQSFGQAVCGAAAGPNRTAAGDAGGAAGHRGSR